MCFLSQLMQAKLNYIYLQLFFLTLSNHQKGGSSYTYITLTDSIRNP